MTFSTIVETPSSKEILDFFSSTPPFSDLDQGRLIKLTAKCRVETQPAGQVVLTRNQSEVNHLRVVYSGRLRLYLEDGEGGSALETFRGPGDAIGFLGLLLGSKSNLNVETQEPTVFLVLPREDFFELIREAPGFSEYYLQALAEGYVSKALTQLQRPRPRFDPEGSLYMFSAQVGDVVRKKPEIIDRSMTVQEAARTMQERRAGCLLVNEPSGKIVGIVTDRDVRNKVVATGQPSHLPVSRIMSSPVHTVAAHTYCFDALLEMMANRVHHLAVEAGGEIVGVISGHDLMVLQGTSPLYLVREISGTRRIEGLYDLSLKSPRVVNSLIQEGAKAGHVTRIITMINDYILERLLTLVEEDLGPPPVPFCWLLMGSEGRREQTFRTDQDNGLIYADPQGPEQAARAKDYFRMFGNEVIRHLVACGFPRCKGGIMASNPQWCQPYSVWADYFDTWILKPVPKDVLHATIFFDFRPGPGTTGLANDLRDHLLNQVKGQEVFLRFLAKDALTTQPAVSFFRQFAVEKHGKHKNKFDIKTKGLVPFVDFARIMSLRHSVPETNTMRRIQLLGEGRFISRELQQQASQAYEYQMQIRLLHQHILHEEGLEPDNFIDPRDLSQLERQALKEALSVAGDIRSFLKEEFRLGAA